MAFFVYTIYIGFNVWLLMTVKIRLARFGAKKRPYYRIVVANSNAPRDGKFLEKVGIYNPMLSKEDENRVVLNQDRIKHWLSVGAQPTERVSKFLEKTKFIKIKTIMKRGVRAKITTDRPAEKELKEKDKVVAGKPVEKKVEKDKAVADKPVEEKLEKNKKAEDDKDK